MEFLDDQLMSSLYEKFLLNYFKKEHPYIKTHAPQIEWQIDEGVDFLLPKMKTDVTLEYGSKILIMDAKFYTHNTSENYGKSIHHTGNLYQIFTYVKNEAEKQKNERKTVAGVLLYAKTDDDITAGDKTYSMSGNTIAIHSLDLNQNFSNISEKLNAIADKFFS